MIYDLIIIGGGPAGTAAAVYASRKRLKTLLITSEWGGQSVVSEKIYNWIGTHSISGKELAENLKNHVIKSKGESLEIKENEKVTSIFKTLPDVGHLESDVQRLESGDEILKDLFEVTTEKKEVYITKTILIASGSGRRKLEAKNADIFEHKGLTYCASCDGPLFSDMDVVVIGGGNAGFETAAQLLAYCKSVTLLNRSDSFRADEITVEKVLKNPKMKAIKNVDILEVTGDKFVEGIIYKSTEANSQENITLKISGIFVEIGQIPNTSFAKELIPLDEYSRVKINPLNQQTEIKGIWAAGDCSNVLYHQNNIAAGDAVRALEDIYLYIHTK